MFIAPKNTDLLLQEAEKETLYVNLITQLNKDFNLANEAVDFPLSLSPNELKILNQMSDWFAERNEVIKHHFIMSEPIYQNRVGRRIFTISSNSIWFYTDFYATHRFAFLPSNIHRLFALAGTGQSF